MGIVGFGGFWRNDGAVSGLLHFLNGWGLSVGVLVLMFCVLFGCGYCF